MNWLSWFFLQGHSHLQIFGSAKRTIDSVGFLLCLCSRLSLRLVALIKMRSLLKLLVVFFFLLWNVKSHFIASSARLTSFSLKGEWVRVSERERASQRERASEPARERESEREREREREIYIFLKSPSLRRQSWTTFYVTACFDSKPHRESDMRKWKICRNQPKKMNMFMYCQKLFRITIEYVTNGDKGLKTKMDKKMWLCKTDLQAWKMMWRPAYTKWPTFCVVMSWMGSISS